MVETEDRLIDLRQFCRLLRVSLREVAALRCDAQLTAEIAAIPELPSAEVARRLARLHAQLFLGFVEASLAKIPADALSAVTPEAVDGYAIHASRFWDGSLAKLAFTAQRDIADMLDDRLCFRSPKAAAWLLGRQRFMQGWLALAEAASDRLRGL